MITEGNLENKVVLKAKSRLTKRAPDVWDSAAFSSIFLASSFLCSQAESTPAHTQVTQTVRAHPCKAGVMVYPESGWYMASTGTIDDRFDDTMGWIRISFSVREVYEE